MYNSSKSSIEEADNFSSDVSFSALLVSEDALGGRQNKVSELSGGENVAGPLFELGEKDIVPWRDDSALVDAADQFDDDLFASVVIDDLELSDVLVLLHDPQELDENLGDRPQEHLLLTLAFSVHDGFEGICQDVDLDHFCGEIITNKSIF